MYYLIVDLVILAIFLRSFFVYKEKNIYHHFFLLLGTFCGTVISLHYYISFGDFLKDKLVFVEGFHYALAFCFLAVIVPVFFYFLSEGWHLILKIEASQSMNIFLGFVFSLIRYYLIASLVLVGLVIIGNESVSETARVSLLGRLLNRSSTGIYYVVYKNFIHRFSPNEPLNQEVLDLMEVGKKELSARKARSKDQKIKQLNYQPGKWEEFD